MIQLRNPVPAGLDDAAPLYAHDKSRLITVQ